MSSLQKIKLRFKETTIQTNLAKGQRGSGNGYKRHLKTVTDHTILATFSANTFAPFTVTFLINKRTIKNYF